jgi:AhpD family alkylhydroperoxidase
MSTTALISRQPNPVVAVPGAMDAIHGLSKAVSRTRVPINLELVHLRASQINGCSVCVDMHAKAARKAGETEERLFAVAAWRDTPFFTDAERAALALTEALTRLADRADAVPDELWDEVAEHFDETQRAALVVEIAHINLWNRVNVATRQMVGEQGW